MIGEIPANVDEDDLAYFITKLERMKTPEAKLKVQKQIDVIKEALSIYRNTRKEE